MNSKQQKTEMATNQKVAETVDQKTVDDDNKSDSEYEYEYEEIEVEVDEDYEEIVDETGKVLISEVETIVPADEKKAQETLMLKSDGTTERLVQKRRTAMHHHEKHAKQEKERRERRISQEKRTPHDKQEKREKQEKSEKVDMPRLGRTLTSQEESILLPLLQGLLAANGTDTSKLKHENTPFCERDQEFSKRTSRSNSFAENNDKSTDGLAKGSNILEELSAALNRLQTTLLEEKEVVTDTRKRNTILTLVAWLKRVLQTSTSENAEAQLFSLSEQFLPTELLLTKLMPQLNQSATNSNSGVDATQNERSPASSKRFMRQRNNRFNTVGVSKEELADARLFLQEKLLTENLATTETKPSRPNESGTAETKPTNVLNEDEENRRKSLNLSESKKLNRDIRAMFRESKGSYSKSVEGESPDDQTANPKQHVFPVTRNEQSNNNKMPTVNNQSKSTFRRKQMPSKDVATDSDDDDEENVKISAQQIPNNTANITSKSMNKFALRKMKMKRANTIDVPKDQADDTNSDQGYFEGYKTNSQHDTANDQNQSVKTNLPQFQPKSSGDKKFFAFLNKNATENHAPWVNPQQTAAKTTNWSSKFGNLKNSFEQSDHSYDHAISPGLSKKNNFTHAPTSAFQPVQGNKPPQIPNGIHHQHQYQCQNVQNKVAAIQSHEKVTPMAPMHPKPQLRTHQSVPTYPIDGPTQMYRDANGVQTKSNVHLRSKDWQQNKYASVDSYMQSTPSPSTAYNPLYVPMNQSPSYPPYTSPNPFNNINQMGPKPYTPPAQKEFPSYTYTSTDYTQPSLSTFGPNQPFSPTTTNSSPLHKNMSPAIQKTPILPDTSYLKSTITPPRSMPPPLHGSGRLNKQSKHIDVYSSNEYLSEPNNYYRTPHPFSPISHDSRRNSQELMANTQIMKYPSGQMATVYKTQRYDDEQQAQNLRSFLSNNVRNEKRQSEYSEKSISPFSETNFSHVNRTYVPPPPPNQSSEPIRNKPNNTFMSMENISSMPYGVLEEGAPIRLANNTSYYSSHNALANNQFSDQHAALEFTKNQFNQGRVDMNAAMDKSKISSPLKLNSCGGTYVQAKVKTDLDFSKPTYGKKSLYESPTSIVRNNIANLNRSHTLTNQRAANYEFKRKQSLPAQGSDYFNAEYEKPSQPDPSSFSHKYLPFGALKKSKSTHTLALLQQFESKGKTSADTPPPSYARRPDPEPKPKPIAEIKPKSIIKKTSPIEAIKSPQSMTSVSPNVLASPRPSTQNTPIQSRSPMQQTTSVRSPPSESLVPPEITETPSSPLVEDGHIIFPGQTTDTKRRVQHYAQTLNAMLNRKSIVLEDDNDDDNDNTAGDKIGVQRSKSGTLLSVPKQYESAIKKSELLEKERTVAAYFGSNKSPSQNVQRSSSQHSMLSSSSTKTVEGQKSSTVSPMQSNDLKDVNYITDMQDSHSRTTTTTTKSAHHLKILRRQQKQTSPNALAKSSTLPNLLDESNVDDAIDDLFASFGK